ncbi:hypothetical protein ACJMK2_040169 [Sinanodonta woodiana]|uniref:Actin-related protein 5 n=1 Tax=Sinanodonta woodiana TaxID=1069815 RepID=A0ABD3WHM6_SINWO
MATNGMSNSAVTSTNIFTFKDERPGLDPILEYTESIRDGGVPIVIDNGSYQCRAGWALSPKPQFIFKNITARQRGKKETDVQVGNEITNLEVVRWMVRTPFDRNLVTLYDVQEQILDYIFAHLGINTEGEVSHPIVMTEPVCNPNFCRAQMSELLFECYHVPKVAYGVDALFSLLNNHPAPEKANSMIVDCGYQTVHLLPVIGGQLDPSNCRRINLGGAQLDVFMQRLLQLKYPGHSAVLTLSRAEEILRDHCYIAKDYQAELDDWVSNEYYDENVHKIQLPYTNVPGSQISAQQQKERRDQQIKRLKELNNKKRMEKLAAEEESLQQLMSVQELLEDDDEDTFNRALAEAGYETTDELQAAINHLTASIQRLKAKILKVEPPPVEIVEPKKEPIYDLIEVPDDQLTPEQLTMKKRQKILKKAREGREKAQNLQREKRLKELEEERELERKRQIDFVAWLQEVRQRRQKLLDQRAARKQRKTDMSKRKTFAAQQRMKIISQLAGNTKKEDTFGQDDKDWDVYKEINPNNSDSDSEAEEDKLEELETMLREHDPEFQKELGESAGEFDIAEYYRLHLAIERIRVPELLFQPSMIGMEQAGIVETMDYVFRKYKHEVQNELAQYVFLTGSNANLPNFCERLEKELLAIRPFKSVFNVYKAGNPSLDAWLGARKWALSPTFSTSFITRSEYEEKGGEYFKEHTCSNRFFPTPVLVSK